MDKEMQKENNCSAVWCDKKECQKLHCARHPVYARCHPLIDGDLTKGRCRYYVAVCNLTRRQRRAYGVE